MTRLSIVMPVLDEAEGLPATLQALSALRQRGVYLIVVDGGSTDDTAALAAAAADRVLAGPAVPRGRARQMNAGAAVARGDVILFLHADTLLPPDADALIAQALVQGARWGRFDVCIGGGAALFPVIAALMNWRSRLTGIATGDQALFVERKLFTTLGGYADQPLMEDIEISRRLRAVARPACLRARVQTSGRRWLQHGVWRTVLLMWRLRWRYWRGESPESLARAYR